MKSIYYLLILSPILILLSLAAMFCFNLHSRVHTHARRFYPSDVI